MAIFRTFSGAFSTGKSLKVSAKGVALRVLYHDYRSANGRYSYSTCKRRMALLPSTPTLQSKGVNKNFWTKTRSLFFQELGDNLFCLFFCFRFFHAYTKRPVWDFNDKGKPKLRLQIINGLFLSIVNKSPLEWKRSSLALEG